MTPHLLHLDPDALSHAPSVTHFLSPGDADASNAPAVLSPALPEPLRCHTAALPDLLLSAPSRAATLLSPAADTPNGNAARLFVGLGGIALLGVLGPSALFVANLNLANGGILDWLKLCVLQMLAFTAVAALALTMALPGLWTLLAIFAIPLEVSRMINAVSRSALRAGLFCLGFAPCILLYTATGGDASMAMLSGSLCYRAAGVLAVFSMGLDLNRALTTRLPQGRALLLAWLCLSSVLGSYLYTKMHVWIFFHGVKSW